MTAISTDPRTFWDEAIDATLQWVAADALVGTSGAYAIWTFKDDFSTQNGIRKIWPTEASSDCPSFDPSTGFCITSDYDQLATTIEGLREAERAVVGPSTPLAGSLCDILDSVAHLPTLKRIILQSDGGENSTNALHACQGIASISPLGAWDFTLDDWGMTIDSWPAKVTRRAARLSTIASLAVEGVLMPTDAIPPDLIWLVDFHFALFTPATLAAASVGSPGLEAVADSPFAAGRVAATLSADPEDSAEFHFFRNLGNSTEGSVFTAYAHDPNAMFGVDHALQGDVNNDACVDQADICSLTSDSVWLQRAVAPNDDAVLADLTRDGWVNFTDREVVLENWGAGCAHPSHSPLPPGRPEVTTRAIRRGFLCPTADTSKAGFRN